MAQQSPRLSGERASRSPAMANRRELVGHSRPRIHRSRHGRAYPRSSSAGTEEPEGGTTMNELAYADSGASSSAIQFHYDLSNDFYSAWLDRSMTYSAAMFDAGITDLERAQIRKLDYHLESAGARGARRILDVGCGWGSLLKRSATCDVEHVVGLTLSPAQLAYAEAERIPNAEVGLESWRDHSPDLPYDAIVSIGAFEHFVRPELSPADKIRAYRDFFKFCRMNLKSQGKLSLQTIAWGSLRAEQAHPFITGSVFPES